MAEDKKDSIGGIPSIYWRYIARIYYQFLHFYMYGVAFSTPALLRTIR